MSVYSLCLDNCYREQVFEINDEESTLQYSRLV